ncbi:MAG: heavy-metal-associated domain-containing protein [Phycisphaerae bacterium]|nr:heavy-metal-associated domain-containing protein [Phycisphaerae bacterium]MDW8261910.1 heavy-metal-associated domain-containing protein [Phycisphaerales bacterium]
MAADVSRDRLALISIEGMHCHKCESAIRKALSRNAGVHEVEVDFLSGQCSILFDGDYVNIDRLIDSVTEAGYRPTGYAQRDCQNFAA